MGLRIGCDLDGVLADIEGALTREAAQLFGSQTTQSPSPSSAAPLTSGAPPPELTDDTSIQHGRQLTARQVRQLWRRVREIDNFWESLEETEPGVVARLFRLAGERRWEIIFLTRRPETAGAPAQLQSQRWLETKGFRLPSVYVVTSSRGQIAAALTLDVVIDDTPANCVDVVSDSRARTIVVYRRESPPPAAMERLGVQLVRSTHECLDLLAEFDASQQKRTGPIDRVLRTLGLKQPANA